TARVFDVASGTQTVLLAGDHAQLSDAIFSPDGEGNPPARADETNKKWGAGTAGEIKTLFRHPRGGKSICFLTDDSGLISCGNNGRLASWSFATADSPGFKLHREGVTNVVALADGLTALSAGGDRRIKQFDLATGHELRSLTLDQRALAL